MKSWPLGLRVGILGGGQLARMLAHSAQSRGLEVHVLCPSSTEPAAQVTGFHHAGSADNSTDLQKFLTHIDVLTFESEFFNMDLIEKLRPKGLPIFPEPALMRMLQDRSTQKELLRTHKIPTADFVIVRDLADLAPAFQKFPKGFVLKKNRGGYDGYGTFYARSAGDLTQLRENFPGPSIAESFIPFKRELAAIAVCGEKDLCFLPLIESKQTQSRCDWAIGPVKHRLWSQLQQKIKRMLRKTKYRGVIAFELFDTGSELLVNEVAPRVHNSGHYSMQALSRSQFDLHWESGLGLPVEEPKLLSKSFVMTNLVGESSSPFIFPPKLAGTLHWYGKSENRAGRKMGHINYLGENAALTLKKAQLERRRIKK